MKAFGGRLRGQGSLWLEVRQVEEAARNPDFYLYVVENVGQGDVTRFELRIIGGTQLRELLAGGKEHRYYEIPVRAAEYAKLPRLDR